MPFSIAPILPAALHRLIIPAAVLDAFESAKDFRTGGDFARRMLELLEIRYEGEEHDLALVPARWASVAVANHRFVESLVLAAVLERVRPNAKIVANTLRGRIGEFGGSLILVNPFETPAARRENLAPLREALGWLFGGRLPAVLPADEVASVNWKQHSITDPPCKTTAFQLAATLHPVLRTIALRREFQKLTRKTVRLWIVSPITASVLAGYRDAEKGTPYMRSRTFFLSNRSEPAPALSGGSLKVRVRTIAPPGPERLLTEEVATLPADCELTGNTEFAVYLAPARAIPRLLREIARCRELAFRQADEGTGCETDLDRFDGHYQHLFLWRKRHSRLAGAYRLAATSDVLPRFGIAGLYASTLFRFHRQFFKRMGPAVELGRSFVMPEYQKNYVSLLLLWKGITCAVQRRPEAPVLFGAVSISKEYQAASRGLIATYLSGHASHELARFVQPRRRFRHRVMRDGKIKRFATLAADIEDVSLSVSDIEHDAKGVPVLLRQYLKAGGRLLGFNLDPNFSDVLDALIVADLRTAPAALLEHCMGAPTPVCLMIEAKRE